MCPDNRKVPEQVYPKSIHHSTIISPTTVLPRMKAESVWRVSLIHLHCPPSHLLGEGPLKKIYDINW